MRRLRPSADRRRLLLGGAAAFAVAAVILSALGLIWRARDVGGTAGAVDLWHLVRMTAIQAGLTTVLSLIAGIGLAWALDRTRFAGRRLLIGLLSAAFVTPGLVVAVGLIAVWGRAGWINDWLAPLGLHTGSIFGLHGILYAHVLLDATFAAALLLARLEAIAGTR